MKGASTIAGLVILIVAAAGCGSERTSTSNRAILLAGYTHMAGRSPSPSDAAARRNVNGQIRQWRASLTTSKLARQPPEITAREYRHRLATAAARYKFTVQRVEFIHARHARALTPFVIVQTRHYEELARAIPVFLPTLCARRGCFAFFEAQDERGVPFIALGRGQWARSEPLYPFAHG